MMLVFRTKYVPIPSKFLPLIRCEQLTVYSVEHNGRNVLGMGTYLVSNTNNSRFIPLNKMEGLCLVWEPILGTQHSQQKHKRVLVAG